MERESGFRTFFEKETSIKKESIHSITVDQSKIDSLKQLFKPFSQSKEPIGIFVTNSRAYLLPELLDDIGFKADRIIIGFDLNRGNIKLLEENKIQFIINQQPEYQGYSAVKGLFKMITENDEADLYQKIPIEIIVRENIE
jgi:LacI family transcriptional regulator